MSQTLAYQQIANQQPNWQEVEQHMPLVKKIAFHLRGRLPSSVLVDDLIQAGVVGLLEALQKYSQQQGASFETYASIRIRGAMIDEMRRGDWTPRSVHRKSREISRVIAELEKQLGRHPSDDDIAEALGTTLAEYHQMLRDTQGASLLSIDEPDHFELAESQIPDEKDENPLSILSQDKFKHALANYIGQLPEKEKLVMALYYDEELNLKEIGEVLGVSESRVSQIHSSAIKRLRSKLIDWM
ncbi:RNA polymerase sigma factor FliA [Thiomicrospira sp. ALE5]|uniref:RNA polymerase sigma factor FliA n=1 Tax=Thiomicrospira sp. ALE5 TaxID=748650 RepID=UPI0008E0E2B2|nr:RNA polymerase sigma factor FliA [Thiomicrospira sp. ALE5]SFR59129.1 RNA polymerase sigma factor for flagellar operon FliA [Thiomicrospira sp. ALE5]